MHVCDHLSQFEEKSNSPRSVKARIEVGEHFYSNTEDPLFRLSSSVSSLHHCEQLDMLSGRLCGKGEGPGQVLDIKQ